VWTRRIASLTGLPRGSSKRRRRVQPIERRGTMGLQVRIIPKTGLKTRRKGGRKHRERRDRTAVTIVNQRTRTGGNHRPRIAAARTTIVLRGM